MSNVYTSTDSGSLGTSLVQTALDKHVNYLLRAQPMFRGLADKRVVDQSYPGVSVVFQFWNEIADNVAELSETVDPDAFGVPSTTSVTVTLKEYGATILATRKLQLVAITDVDSGLSDLLAWHMRDQIDKLVEPFLTGGTHVIRRNSGNLRSDMITAGAGTIGAVASTDILTSSVGRLAVAKFRGNKVVPRQGELYAAFCHPDCAHDLKAEVGNGSWRVPHEFSGAESIWMNNIGVYEGLYYIETPRITSALSGASSARVYKNFAMGREALAEAVGEEVSIRQGPITDKLGRFTPWGWYGLLGWSRFREDALIRMEVSSSIAA
jgi:N4-gp56 family major capsid protein